MGTYCDRVRSLSSLITHLGPLINSILLHVPAYTITHPFTMYYSISIFNLLGTLRCIYVYVSLLITYLFLPVLSHAIVVEVVITRFI